MLFWRFRSMTFCYSVIPKNYASRLRKSLNESPQILIGRQSNSVILRLKNKHVNGQKKSNNFARIA